MEAWKRGWGQGGISKHGKHGQPPSRARTVAGHAKQGMRVAGKHEKHGMRVAGASSFEAWEAWAVPPGRFRAMKAGSMKAGSMGKQKKACYAAAEYCKLI